MQKIKRLALCLLLFTIAPVSWALGMGELTLSSKLGEKLSASIPILDSAGFNLEQVKATNAPLEVYQQMGVENSYVYQVFDLLIEEDQNGLKLLIQSKDPIREPYLNFIIQVKWPEGQLNKEYKVFIDP